VSPEFSVVVVNFNAGEDLRTCLESVSRSLSGRIWDAVVVDNASTDESCSSISHYESVSIHRNQTNTGFASGVNLGLSLTSGKYVLIINPDCWIEGGAVGCLESELERHSKCALVGPKILDLDGTVQGSARGDPTMLTGLFGRTALLGRLFPGSSLARKNVRALEMAKDSSSEVDWVSGACMLARRGPLLAAGGFDTRYFLYWEDADLCRRLRAQGLTIRYVPDAEVVHRVGQSRSMAKSLAIREFHRSAYLYYRTHVATSSASLSRWIAKGLLSVRCAWKLFRATGIRVNLRGRRE
jgi:GT2 family glycosyltransferase